MTNRRLSRFAPLLQVPPASRGEAKGGAAFPASRGEAKGGAAFPASRGEAKGGAAFPASRGEPSHAPARFPLLAGGTLRRGFTKSTIEEVYHRKRENHP
jgi:hypothetical protein